MLQQTRIHHICNYCHEVTTYAYFEDGDVKCVDCFQDGEIPEDKLHKDAVLDNKIILEEE